LISVKKNRVVNIQKSFSDDISVILVDHVLPCLVRFYMHI